jgi:hypothetical protein
VADIVGQVSTTVPENGTPSLVRQVLRDRGPMTGSALAEAVGLDEDSVFDALDEASDDTVSLLLDGRWALGSALLEDRGVHALAVLPTVLPGP